MLFLHLYTFILKLQLLYEVKRGQNVSRQCQGWIVSSIIRHYFLSCSCCCSSSWSWKSIRLLGLITTSTLLKVAFLSAHGFSIIYMDKREIFRFSLNDLNHHFDLFGIFLNTWYTYQINIIVYEHYLNTINCILNKFHVQNQILNLWISKKIWT